MTLSIQETSHLSIQGEKQQKDAYQPLTAQEADEYVDSHSEGVVDCRMTMRHIYPRPRRGQLPVVEIDAHNNLVVEYECVRCGCATRREWWHRVQRGKEMRYEFLDKATVYHRNKDGETYLLAPGMGRGRPTQFRESVMTTVTEGLSPAAILKALNAGVTE